MKKLILSTLFAIAFANAEELDPKLKLPLPDNIKAELLFSYPATQDKDFTTEDALKICRDYQGYYAHKYFYVMCKLKFDEINEKEFALVPHENWIFMGITVTESRDHWGYYRRTETPIFKKEIIKKWELDKINKRKVVTIAVWGVGNFETEKFKVVYPSAVDAPALIDLSFQSKADAWLSCLEILSEKKRTSNQQLRFERAQCRLKTDKETGRFKIQIVSQNPFL